MMKIKIYSETGIVPAYKTAGASGFDLHVKRTEDTCPIIYREDVEFLETIDVHYLDPVNRDKAYYIFDTLNIDRTLIRLYGINLFCEFIQNGFKEKCKEILKEKSNYPESLLFADYMYNEKIDGVNIILPFSHNILPTDIYAELEPGTEIQVRPKSGIASKTNMIIHFGTVDSDYRGDIGIIINNPSPYSFPILPGERLAQGVFSKVEQIIWDNVETYQELNQTDRGQSGYGSTGKF